MKNKLREGFGRMVRIILPAVMILCLINTILFSCECLNLRKENSLLKEQVQGLKDLNLYLLDLILIEGQYPDGKADTLTMQPFPYPDSLLSESMDKPPLYFILGGNL